MFFSYNTNCNANSKTKEACATNDKAPKGKIHVSSRESSEVSFVQEPRVESPRSHPLRDGNDEKAVVETTVSSTSTSSQNTQLPGRTIRTDKNKTPKCKPVQMKLTKNARIINTQECIKSNELNKILEDQIDCNTKCKDVIQRDPWWLKDSVSNVCGLPRPRTIFLNRKCEATTFPVVLGTNRFDKNILKHVKNVPQALHKLLYCRWQEKSRLTASE